jgi:hypothetical protein
VKFDRQNFLAGSLGLTAGVTTTSLLALPKYRVNRRRPRSRVAILTAESYSEDLEQILSRGLDLFHLDIRGTSVLIKRATQE